MFNFMKKASGELVGEERDADKERRKREKKERKDREKRERLNGAEEPLRLDEVRRSLKLRGRRKEKEKLPSGITADYSACFLANLERDIGDYSNYPVISNSGSNSNLSDENNHLSPNYSTSHAWNKRDVLQSDSSETSLNSLNNPNNANTSPRQPPNLPPIPPRPPKRGILKGPRLSNASNNSQESNVHGLDAVDYVNGQDPNLLARNTLQNEMMSYNMHGSKSASSDDILQVQNFTKKVIHSPVDCQSKNYQNNHGNSSVTVTTQDYNESQNINGNNIGVTSTSPSADSLTDTTTNSSFATPPFSMSPVGESQGFHRWSRTTFEDVYLPLPYLKPVPLPKPRVLTIQRQKAPRNDFGFSLRRAIIQERTFSCDPKESNLTNGHSSPEANGYNSDGAKTNGFTSTLTFKPVILAEPGSMTGGHETGLLPGDRLLEVNGVSVDGKTREEIIELIKGSQDSVTIKVQPIAELSELSRRRAADGADEVELAEGNIRSGTLSRSGSRRFGKSQAKSEEQLATEQEWLSGGRMWLAHRGGFTAVRREGDAEGGRVSVRVLQTGEVITVDEDDLEKANPPQLDRCEDIAGLRCLNECGALHVLRARYAAGTPHARAGHALLVLGPPRRNAPIYTDKVASMFRGCRAEDMPPHVYACAQAAHRCMLAARRDRAIVFLGRCGSGKTTAMRHCVSYLATVCSAPATKLTPERFEAAFTCLQHFGNCRSISNPNASRFVSLVSLDFDGGGALVSASIQTLLPDLKPPQENTFHSLYSLVHGCDGRLRRELLLDQVAPGVANPYVCAAEAGRDATAEFASLQEALTLLGVTEKECRTLWQVLAAICHLGLAGVARAPTGCALKYQFADAASAERAARVIGVAVDELSRAAFSGATGAPAAQQPQPAPRNNLRTPSPSMERELTGAEALDGLVIGLYNEVFNMVASLVNRSLTTSARTSSSILLLDAPGADNPMCAGQQSGAGLSRLMANYLQERLQLAFHEAMLVAPRERYAQEGISLTSDGTEDDWMSETVNPGPMVELLDKAPQNTIVRSSQNDLRECDRRGLFWLLEEESMYPGSSDDTFLERVLTHYGAPARGSHAAGAGAAFHHLVKKAPHARQLILQHMQGTNPVLYDVTGWVKASRENPVTKKALPLLQESQNEELSHLASWSRGCSTGVGGATLGDMATLRRASSIRRSIGTHGAKRRSAALQAKFVADGIVDTLRRCGAGGVKFVCCLLSEHRGETEKDDVNIPLLRSQFRGFQLLDAARLYKQGFPEHMPLAEFARRYRLLAHSAAEGSGAPETVPATSDRQLAEDMLPALDLDISSYRLGLTQIFFRPGIVAGLDARRDAALARVLVSLQARARGLLARRRARKLRTQHTAARCIQRNVRAFLAVRDWPWWRMLVRVTPLLAVHRTEERLKLSTEEVETLRARVEKLEHEKNYYKTESEKLESKLSECNADLAEERSAAALAAERADAEASERLRLERDNRDISTNNQRLQQASERLELELLHWRSADAGGATSDEEGSDGGGERYKRRYERVARELQLTKAQLRRQHEDDLEQLVSVKKQLEKKLADAYEEVDEQRQVAAQWKRKMQKLTNDMADLRSLLDEQTCRNNLLEKRQRKFDAEQHALQDELKRERTARERLSREKDTTMAEKYAAEQTLSEVKLELELKEERLAALTREAEEARGGGGGGEGELALLRRARVDLERRVRDQEEELDELAGQIQLLESSKLRLEMLLEQQRKEARLEAAARDDEMEETRANASKKVKILESQLETEHGERTLLLRERHELERRLSSLEEVARAEQQEQQQLIQRLKRDLKRYRALLRDAQTMLEQKEKDSGGKAQIRQLKNQVEDLELAVRAATKARQSAEAEAAEATAALEESNRARQEACERAATAVRDAAAMRAQLDDAEEEAAEVLKKYRSSTSALCAAQAAARESSARAEAATEEARALRDKLAECSQRLAAAEAGHGQDAAEAERRLELRTKELESSMELEQTARARLEGQLSRLRDAHDKLAGELGAARAREQQAHDEVRKMSRQLREVREEHTSLTARMEEATRARGAAEAAAAAAAAEAAAARDEARLAARRANALQEAIAGDLSSPNDSRDTDSENDSYSSDESIGTFLANHKLSPSVPSRASVHLDSQRSQGSEGRQSRSSVGSAKQLSPTKDSFA